MVSATTEGGQVSTWVLRPNQSLSWREAKLVYGGILVVSLAIAISFASLGFWPVLPFAGAELLGLGAAFYYCQRRGQLVEVVSVDGGRVAVEKGRNAPERRWDFERAWVQVQMRRSRIAGHPSRLILRSHGREVSVGDFLVEEERHKVHEDLQKVLRSPTEYLTSN